MLLYEWTREKHNRSFGVAADHVISTELRDQKFSASIVSTMAETTELIKLLADQIQVQRQQMEQQAQQHRVEMEQHSQQHRVEMEQQAKYMEQQIEQQSQKTEQRCRIYWNSWTFKNMALVKMIPEFIILSCPLLLFRHLLHLIRR